MTSLLFTSEELRILQDALEVHHKANGNHMTSARVIEVKNLTEKIELAERISNLTPNEN